MGSEEEGVSILILFQCIFITQIILLPENQILSEREPSACI